MKLFMKDLYIAILCSRGQTPANHLGEKLAENNKSNLMCPFLAVLRKVVAHSSVISARLYLYKSLKRGIYTDKSLIYFSLIFMKYVS